jgi:hypothetical protein
MHKKNYVEDNSNISASCGSAVVEQKTHNCKFEGSDLAPMDARDNSKNICLKIPGHLFTELLQKDFFKKRL